MELDELFVAPNLLLAQVGAGRHAPCPLTRGRHLLGTARGDGDGLARHRAQGAKSGRRVKVTLRLPHMALASTNATLGQPHCRRLEETARHNR